MTEYYGGSVSILIFLACLALGWVGIRYPKPIVDNTMHFLWLEQYLGAGGTYLFWQGAGLLIIAYGFYQLFN